MIKTNCQRARPFLSMTEATSMVLPATPARQFVDVRAWLRAFTFVFFKIFPQFFQLLSNLAVIPSGHNQNMKKRAVEMTKDLNSKDRADLKKKHDCSQCNFSTATAGNLRTHKLIHSGETLRVLTMQIFLQSRQ